MTFQMSIRKISIFLLMSAALHASAYADTGGKEDFIFTYDYPGATYDFFGPQRLVQIDAAMLLRDPALVGSEIIGISVDIPSKEGCSCAPEGSGWLTSTLQVDGEFNEPDLRQTTGTIINNGTDDEPALRLDLTFDQPYTLTEGGVYVGYSLDVTSCNVPGSGWTAKYPIVTVEGIDRPEAMMIHCTKGSSSLPQKYAEWTDIGSSVRQGLAMRVIMRGTPKGNAASIEPLQTLYAPPASTGHVYTRLINQGTTPISSIEYSYSLESSAQDTEPLTATLLLDSPLSGQVGAYTTIDLPIEVPAQEGIFDASLKINKVNGMPNDYDGHVSLPIQVVPFLPVNRPIIEDYTGFWCGYCPAVYVAVKRMQDKYDDDFLALSYHVDDQLQGVPMDYLPSSSYGLPKVYMNDRETPIEYDNMENLWLLKRRELAPADINVEIEWTDLSHTALRAETNLNFVYDNPDSDYRIACALVEDDMSNPKWLQANYYGDDNFEGPYWDLFCGKGYRVPGIVYDDVVVSFPAPDGTVDSLPSDIYAGMEYTHSVTLPLADAICQYTVSENYGNNLILDPGRLRVVALLIDGKSGAVVNSATSGYSADAPDDPAAVSTIGTDKAVGIEGVYTLTGQRVANPSSGVNIIRYSDGTARKLIIP